MLGWEAHSAVFVFNLDDFQDALLFGRDAHSFWLHEFANIAAITVMDKT